MRELTTRCRLGVEDVCHTAAATDADSAHLRGPSSWDDDGYQLGTWPSVRSYQETSTSQPAAAEGRRPTTHAYQTEVSVVQGLGSVQRKHVCERGMSTMLHYSWQQPSNVYDGWSAALKRGMSMSTPLRRGNCARMNLRVLDVVVVVVLTGMAPRARTIGRVISLCRNEKEEPRGLPRLVYMDLIMI